MQKNKDGNKPLNPEILREREEKIKTDNLYDDDDMSMSLFPGAFLTGAASATESTGLMQNVAVTPNMIEAYDEVYSFRQRDVQEKSD